MMNLHTPNQINEACEILINDGKIPSLLVEFMRYAALEKLRKQQRAKYETDNDCIK